MLRIQFALPEQGLFTERNYSVRVFMAAQGQAFGADPAFTVDSDEIERAYPNVDNWWSDVEAGSANQEKNWVTRKIDTFTLPTGLDKTIRRQGFEIGTILAGYPKFKVVVISDETGKELNVKEGVVSADGQWSTVMQEVSDRVKKSNGDLVPLFPQLPEPGAFDSGNIFSRFTGMVFRVAHVLDIFSTQTGIRFVQGVVAGFKDGIEGDKETVGMIRTAFTTNPRHTAKSMYEFFVKIKDAVPSFDSALGFVKSLYTDSTFQLPSPEDAALKLAEGGYYLGYLVGYIIEQALVTVILAGALAVATFVTAGIGAPVAAAIAGTKIAGWVTKLGSKGAAILRSLGHWMSGIAEAAGATARAREALGLMYRYGDKLAELWAKYGNAGGVVKRLQKTAEISQDLAGRALHWLTFADRMSDAAAGRFIKFFERLGQQAGEAWAVRWSGLTNGARGMKNGFEAYDRAGDIADGAQDALVVAGSLDHTVPGRNYAKDYADKYRATAQGDRVESSLSRIRQNVADARYSDDAIQRATRQLSNPAVAALSDEAVEGAVRFTARAGADLSGATREALLARLLDQAGEDAEAILGYLGRTQDVDAPIGMRKLLRLDGITCAAP
jgi:hypothetical protein